MNQTAVSKGFCNICLTVKGTKREMPFILPITPGPSSPYKFWGAPRTLPVLGGPLTLPVLGGSPHKFWGGISRPRGSCNWGCTPPPVTSPRNWHPVRMQPSLRQVFSTFGEVSGCSLLWLGCALLRKGALTRCRHTGEGTAGCLSSSSPPNTSSQ